MEKRGAARRGRTILSLSAGFTNTNAPERPTSRRLQAVVASWNWPYSACSVPGRALKLGLLGRGRAYCGGAVQGCADLSSAVRALKLRRLAVAGTASIEFRPVAASDRIHPDEARLLVSSVALGLALALRFSSFPRFTLTRRLPCI